MVKPARATVSAAGTSNAERFVLKLGNTLSKRYNLLADVKAEQVVKAFRTAVSALPTGSKLQEALQANFDVYTKLLHAQLSNQLQISEDPAVPAKRVKHSAQPDVPVAPQLLTDRSVSSTEAQPDQCLQLLADTVQLQTMSDSVPQLQRALDTIKSFLQSSVTKHGMPFTPATLQLLQPILAQLMTVCLLQNRHAQTPHRPGHQLDHHLLAQAIAMAAEFQQMVSNKVLDHYVALAAHDIKAVVLELLLASPWSCCWSAQSQEAKALWRTLYKAALQHMPTGISAVDYLLIVAASQKASRLFSDPDFEVAATGASIPAPLSLMTWVQQLPASTVAKQCQAFAKRGPQAVTNHLLHSVDEDTLAALRQSLHASSKPTADEDTVQAQDDMLFYVDDAGESAFGKGWLAADEPQIEADAVQLLEDLSKTDAVQSSSDSE